MKNENYRSRKIILIRHGELAKPEGPIRCVSATDYPLTDYGRFESAKTGAWLCANGYENATVVASPLTRCVETARIVMKALGQEQQEPKIYENLREISCGHWENMTFEEIRKQYPKEFEERGKAFATYEVPGGESFLNAGKRFAAILEEIKNQIDGDIVVVAHAGVARGMLMQMPLENRTDLYGYEGPNTLFNIPQPYAGITIINDSREIECLGYKPLSHLDDRTIEYFYRINEVPEHIIMHMKGVDYYQNMLLDKLETRGISMDRELLHKAAVLHDIKRLSHKHADAGAEFLRLEGYADVAALVKNHHEPVSMNGQPSGGDNPLTEGDILYYVDKRVQEDRLVTVEKRFGDSRHKIVGDEAEKAFNAQLNRSLEIEAKLREILGEEMI